MSQTLFEFGCQSRFSPSRQADHDDVEFSIVHFILAQAEGNQIFGTCNDACLMERKAGANTGDQLKKPNTPPVSYDKIKT